MLRALMLLLPAVAIFGCAHRRAHGDAPTALVRFAPPRAGMEGVFLTGALDGRLVVRDGCFRIRGGARYPDREPQIVWHNHFQLIHEGGRPGVLDTLTGAKVFAGDWVQTGGGVLLELHERVEQRGLGERCGGPWVSVNKARPGKPRF